MKSSFDSFKKLGNRNNPEVVSRTDQPEDFRLFLGQVFEDYKDPKDRVRVIFENIDAFFEFMLNINKEIIPEDKLKIIKSELIGCESILDKEEFINKTAEILKPIFDAEKNYPIEYEEAKSKMSNRRQGYLELNRFVTYEKCGDTIQLHHSEAKKLVELTGSKPGLYKDAMKKLAKIVENDPSIQSIQATSWIVEKMRTTFVRAGFSVEKVENTKPSILRDSHGREKDVEIEEATATISREKFLEVFGEQE